MKITMDVNFAGSRPAGDVSARISARRETGRPESDRAFAEKFAAKLQRDRAIADALAIAQSSRQIIQKAMDASYRLRAIAFEAMTTGRVNMDDLAVEVAGIRGDLAGYGESISVPVDRSSPAARTGEVVGESLQKLADYAVELESGRMVKPDLFTAVANDLKPVIQETDVEIKSYASQFSGARIMNSSTDYVKLNSSTAGLITGNPATGIAAQGNLSSEITGILATT